VDTNILLRFLLGEPAAQAAAAKTLFAKASAGEAVLDISPVIVAETLYTLLSYYAVERKIAIEKLSSLLRQRGVRLRDSSQVFLAFELLRTTNVGFADAFLAAGASEEGVPVISFDRDLDKFKGVSRIDPGNL
jgi:predicted nucleic acid-binding protein